MRAPKTNLGVGLYQSHQGRKGWPLEHRIVVEKPDRRSPGIEGMGRPPVAPTPETRIAEVLQHRQPGMNTLQGAPKAWFGSMINDNHGMRFKLQLTKGF